jgi:hypothetical protein
MAQKQVRKINSKTEGEVIKVDMADRDGSGNVITDTYATQAALNAVANTADSGITQNTASINALGNRVSANETNVSTNAAAISAEVTNRKNAVASEATNRANADTALGGRIDNVESGLVTEASERKADIANLENIANGKTKTFVIEIGDGNFRDTYNRIFDDNATNSIAAYIDYNANPTNITLFHSVVCPFGTLSDDPNVTHGQNIAEYVVFVPAGVLSAAEKQTIAQEAKGYNHLDEAPTIIELNIGDTILIIDTDVPDRWFSGYNPLQSKLSFAKLESTKVDLTAINSAISALQSADTTLKNRIATEETTRGNETSALQTTVNGHTTSISNINTALAGKQDALTFDTAPTAGSSNPVTSGGVKTALNSMQSNLNLQTSIVGTVNI